MSVMIYDTANGAFKDIQAMQRYDPSANAWKDCTSAQVQENGVWVEKLKVAEQLLLPNNQTSSNNNYYQVSCTRSNNSNPNTVGIGTSSAYKLFDGIYNDYSGESKWYCNTRYGGATSTPYIEVHLKQNYSKITKIGICACLQNNDTGETYSTTITCNLYSKKSSDVYSLVNTISVGDPSGYKMYYIDIPYKNKNDDWFKLVFNINSYPMDICVTEIEVLGIK